MCVAENPSKMATWAENFEEDHVDQNLNANDPRTPHGIPHAERCVLQMLPLIRVDALQMML